MENERLVKISHEGKTFNLEVSIDGGKEWNLDSTYPISPEENVSSALIYALKYALKLGYTLVLN